MTPSALHGAPTTLSCVDIHHVPRYLVYIEKVRPALEATGGRYLALLRPGIRRGQEDS